MEINVIRSDRCAPTILKNHFKIRTKHKTVFWWPRDFNNNEYILIINHSITSDIVSYLYKVCVLWVKTSIKYDHRVSYYMLDYTESDHIYTHTHIHTRTHACTHAKTHTHKQTRNIVAVLMRSSFIIDEQMSFRAPFCERSVVSDL